MLYIVSTPIGHPKDITLRALELLQEADYIIGEEQRIASTLLKKLNIPNKELYLLNEHSTENEVEELVELCLKSRVALISDCGTPSFYDPGYQLVKLCRQKNIPIGVAPGASSLMTLLSLVSQKVTEFYFAGFLPADSELRSHQFKKLKMSQNALVLMDTPYRLLKLISELDLNFKKRKILIGLNLTQEQELVLEGTATEILESLNYRGIEKAEFIILIYQDSNPKASSPLSTVSTQLARSKNSKTHTHKKSSSWHHNNQKQTKPQRKKP